MGRIKNIIFDLGAVIMNLDYSKTITAFKDLGYTDFENIYTQYKANDVFNDLEKGLLTEDAFYKYLSDAGPGNINQKQLKDAWNAMLLDFRTESIAFLNVLAPKYNLFLLSNTNTIHKAAIEKIFQNQTGQPSLDVFFKKAYYSHQIGMRKPDEDIYRFVQQDAGINPSETMFIDDLLQNVESASSLGFITHQLLPGERIENLDYSRNYK